MGAGPRQVQIGHTDGSTDVGYHLATLAHGVNIAFDRFGVQQIVGMPMDEARTACLIGLPRMGYADRTLLSQDTINVWLGRPLAFPRPSSDCSRTEAPRTSSRSVVPKLREAA